MTNRDPDRVVLYSSWRGMLAAAFSPLLLSSLGTYALIDGGWRPGPTVVVGLGLTLATVAVFDYPILSAFTRESVTRVCVGRRQVLPWRGVDVVRRARGSLLASPRARFGRTEPSPAAFGGLVACKGRRRYLLVNVCESPDEFRALEKLLGKVVDGPPLTASLPPPSSPPTTLWRRKPQHPAGF